MEDRRWGVEVYGGNGEDTKRIHKNKIEVTESTYRQDKPDKASKGQDNAYGRYWGWNF